MDFHSTFILHFSKPLTNAGETFSPWKWKEKRTRTSWKCTNTVWNACIPQFLPLEFRLPFLQLCPPYRISILSFTCVIVLCCSVRTVDRMILHRGQYSTLFCFACQSQLFLIVRKNTQEILRIAKLPKTLPIILLLLCCLHIFLLCMIL